MVVEGALEYGEDYAREVLETTEGWRSDYWLNDRELARRPWVRDPKAAKVDKMLTAVPKVAAQLNNRLFSENYARLWNSVY